MHFNISITQTTPDVDAIRAAIRSVDPAALVDIGPAGHTLRITASMQAGQLLELMSDAGHAVNEGQLEQEPSECCGGCGG